MSYSMERDSRREGGQWRGCHTFKDIICDGDASSSSSAASIMRKRSGGLMQGSTYYYYYELDAAAETHNPALPSTTTCPYLPGQRVNTLDVPTEASCRQRSASVSSARRSDFKTMNPADKFVTPRPPPATPAVAPAAGPELRELRAVSSLSALRRPLSPLPSPRKLLRHQHSARSLSPAPSISAPSISASSISAPSITAPSFSSWSPRRFFARRASPSREVTNANNPVVDKDADTEPDYFNDGASARYAPPVRLPSSSSSVSTGSRLRYAALAPSLKLSSQGSRSRDISPESLRRFLVDDDVVGNIGTVDTPAVQRSVFDTTDTDDDDLDYEMDYDDANFATSATSENAPFTILSPPPPSRNATPVNFGLQMQQQQQQQQQQHQRQESIPTLSLRTSIPPPAKPARAPSAVSETTSIQRNLAHMSLSLEMPASLSPTSSASMSSLSPMSQSDADDDDECYGAAGEPAALFLPPPQHHFAASDKAHQHQQQKHHRHHLFDAAFTGSTATLVPGNGFVSASNSTGLNELVDELGWMATAIRG